MKKQIKRISIIIRSYNEANYISQVLESISQQRIPSDIEIETILIDSESTDKTVELSINYDCKIIRIRKQDFTFGRSLNIAISKSTGEIIVAISAHCVPYSTKWLANLIDPIINNGAIHSYGKQISSHTSRPSETQIFNQHYPESLSESSNPLDFNFNNANSAFLKKAWHEFKFDENLTGLEDQHFSLQVFDRYKKLPAYCRDAIVFHSHIESNKHVFNRFYRERAALLQFSPACKESYGGLIKLLFKNIYNDLKSTYSQNNFFKLCYCIIGYRSSQFLGETLAQMRTKVN